MSPDPNPLEAIFRRELPRLLTQHRGKYVVVTSEGVHSVWDTSDDAMQAAARFIPGMTGCLVRPILTQEELDAPTEYLKLWNAYYDAGGKVDEAALARLRKTWGMLPTSLQSTLPQPPGRDLGGSPN